MTLQHSRIARPVGDGGGRTIGWWGATLGILTVAHLVGGVLVAAIYLRAYTEVWPPTDGPHPGVVLPLLAVGLTVLAAILASVADRRTRAAQGAAMPLLLGAAVAALVAAGLRGWDTIFSGWPITEHAYWSIRWAIGALDVVLLVTLALVTGVASLHVIRGALRPGAHAELAVVTLWSWATVVFVSATWAVFASVTGGAG